MKAERTVDITGRGHVRATVARQSLRTSFPVLVDVVSALSLREARSLARAIERACDDHRKWRTGEAATPRKEPN